jgi:hypothetical protein
VYTKVSRRQGEKYTKVHFYTLNVQEVLMYPLIVEEEKKSARIVFPPEFRAEWWKLIRKKGMTQQGAVERLIRFVLDQDDLIQSMILDQVDTSDDLMTVALKRIAARKKSKPPDRGG